MFYLNWTLICTQFPKNINMIVKKNGSLDYLIKKEYGENKVSPSISVGLEEPIGLIEAILRGNLVSKDRDRENSCRRKCALSRISRFRFNLSRKTYHIAYLSYLGNPFSSLVMPIGCECSRFAFAGKSMYQTYS